VVAGWSFGTLYSMYVSVAAASPTLANFLLAATIFLILLILGLAIYYTGLFQGWWGQKQQITPSEIPTDKSDAAAFNLNAVEKQIEQIQDEAIRRSLAESNHELAIEREKGAIRVAIFGTGSAGKTSLINAIIGQIAGEVSPLLGTTKQADTYTLELNGLARSILLIDTPGILEVGTDGNRRDLLAREIAADANVILFIIDNDLRASEMTPLQSLVGTGKRVLLVLNKTDIYTPTEAEEIVKTLKKRTSHFLDVADIIPISASPRSVLLASGETFQPSPQINNLLSRLAAILRLEGEDLVAENILLRSQALGEKTRELIERERFLKTNKVINRHQWINAGVVAATPLPAIDFLATAALNTQMAIEIGRIYDYNLDREAAKELVTSLAKTLTGLGIVKGGIQIITTTLQLHPATFLVGHAIQGITAAYLTRIAGNSFVEYFRQGQNWGDRGITAMVEKQFQLTRREDFIQSFVNEAIVKVFR
jgi:small GTP-binding protein